MRSMIAGAAALVVAGCVAQAAGPNGRLRSVDPAVERGRAFAERRCAGCHAVGLDETPAASAPRFRDLRLRYNPISLQKRFAEISAHGSGEMPPIQISQAEAEDLVAYFESLR